MATRCRIGNRYLQGESSFGLSCRGVAEITNLMKSIDETDQLILQSSPLPIQPDTSYKATSLVTGIKGKPYSAYFTVILLNADHQELANGRKIRWLNDFSEKPRTYFIIFHAPPTACYAVVGYRVNLEGALRRSSCVFQLLHPDNIKLVQAQDLPETFDLLEAIDTFVMDECSYFVHICCNLTDMEATKRELAVILEGLRSNITKEIGNIELGSSIRIFMKNRENKVVGGIVANILDKYVYVVLLWVEESLRNRDYGTKLLDLVEKQAVQRGCKYAHLETYSFEARPFYEKNGYELFAVLDDYIRGHSKFFLKKTLAS